MSTGSSLLLGDLAALHSSPVILTMNLVPRVRVSFLCSIYHRRRPRPVRSVIGVEETLCAATALGSCGSRNRRLTRPDFSDPE